MDPRLRPRSALLLLVILFAPAFSCGEKKTFGSDADSDADTDTDTGPETCDEQGATRTVPCGFCGEVSQVCAEDGFWHDEGECENPGECEAGSIGTEACGTCGERERICSSSCGWLEWGDCVEQADAECTRGEVRLDSDGCDRGEVAAEICSDACRWERTEECGADCPGEPRGVGTDAEEICIPGGAFIMGGADATDVDDDPEHEVIVSPYFIGRWEVTNERYHDCMLADACALPAGGYGGADVVDPARARWPVRDLTWQQASDFCSWNGGRLPTEAEWEKAARGSAPDRRRFPWGDEPPTCDQAFHEGCDLPEDGTIDINPDGASPYGVERLAGGAREWTRDFYDPGYYAESPDSDPPGPASGDSHSFRSLLGARLTADQFPVLTGRDGFGDAEDGPGVRCVRGVEVP